MLPALLLVVLLAWPAGPVRQNWPPLTEAERAGLRAMVDRLLLPVHVARLHARPADEWLAMPVEGVRAAQVADTFGAPRPGGRRHQGQDIFARRGTPVRAATDGFVVRIGDDPLGGKVVSVIGAGGRVYYYAHLDAHAPGLRTGDRVRRGALLGRVGTTGNARGTPPHLHFGIHARGGAIDPRPLLRAGAAVPHDDP